MVERDGIRIGKTLYTSPSAAAEAISGSPSNGWLFWHLTSTDEELGRLRDVK